MAPTLATSSIMFMNVIFAIFLLPISTTGSECEKTSFGKVIRYVHGDLLLVIVAPITSLCYNTKGDRKFVLPEIGVDVDRHIEKMNKDPAMFPGLKLGALVVSSCQDDLQGYRMVFKHVIEPYLNEDSSPPRATVLAGMLGATQNCISKDHMSDIGKLVGGPTTNVPWCMIDPTVLVHSPKILVLK